MDVFEAVRTLLAVRSYADRPVPDEVVREIVESGRLSASASNRQPWHFVVVENRDALRELAETAPTGPYIAGASLAIVVAIDKESRTGVSDGSRAIQNMMLTAWDNGLGSNWVGFSNLEGASEVLGIPDHLRVLAIVAFGYPAQLVGRGRKQRKPLAEVASRERFGEPFE